jgi:16S rRNA (adenine1518-N6/adenine1519-N6)-dimethyltransferase
MRHVPRKRFGQNFLVDQTVIARIIQAIDPRPEDTLVEIGPGLGALTDPLLGLVPHLQVVELDRDLAARLLEQYPRERLAVHQADALEFDFSALSAPMRIVGNLPYNISTPLLFRMTAYAAQIADMHFMLQSEVVDRMVASPSTAEYGRLSVMLQYRFRLQKLFTVPASAFRPAPKVESALVRLVPLAPGELLACDESIFRQAVMRAFSHRRKTLRNALSGFAAEADLLAADIDPGLRAENLSVASFVAIANLVSAQPAANTLNCLK